MRRSLAFLGGGGLPLWRVTQNFSPKPNPADSPEPLRTVAPRGILDTFLSLTSHIQSLSAYCQLSLPKRSWSWPHLTWPMTLAFVMVFPPLSFLHILSSRAWLRPSSTENSHVALTSYCHRVQTYLRLYPWQPTPLSCHLSAFLLATLFPRRCSGHAGLCYSLNTQCTSPPLGLCTDCFFFLKHYSTI